MDALMATTAAFATSLSGCSSKDDKPIDRSWPDRSSRPPPSATARHGSSSSGYAVVDPMPMPARCSTVGAGAIRGTATMKSRADGNMDVVIELESAHPPEPIEVHTATGLTPTIGAVTLENRGAKWVVKLTVARASGNLQVLAGVRCSGDPGSVALRVEWSAAIAYGDAYPVTVDASR